MKKWFAIGAIVIALLGITIVPAIQNISRKRSIYSVLQSICIQSSDAATKSYFKGKMPRTEMELCEALQVVHGVPNETYRAKSYSEIRPEIATYKLLVHWLPESKTMLAEIRDENVVYSVTVDGTVVEKSTK